jgi:LCP family protein required for cell wall assembly
VSAPVDGASLPPSDAASPRPRRKRGRKPPPEHARQPKKTARIAPPSTAPDGTPIAPDAKRRRHRRTWPQRLIITFNIALVVVCLVAAGGLAYFKQQYAEIKRIDLGGTLSETSTALEPKNFLLVGLDNDFGLSPDDPVVRGRGGEKNTDKIMILRVDPGSHKAWILSFPRDLLVDIPGGGKQKINSAFSIGGPGTLVETIQKNFQIKINHYVQVNLFGFEQLVDAIGGVPVFLPKEGRDTHSGFPPTGPGCVTLDGRTALGFARSRYYEVKQPNGTWISDPSSDLGRIRRQQEFMRAALKRAIDRGARNPSTLRSLITTAQQNVLLDAGVTAQMLLDLGAEFRDFDPDALEVLTPPVTRYFFGGLDALTLDQQGAQPMFDIFRGANPTLNLLKTVRVEVRNGNGTLGYGKQVADQLGRVGFTAKSTDNPLYKSDTTIIKYATTDDPQRNKLALFNALVLARYFDGDIEIQEDPTITGDSPVALIVGKDYKQPRDTNNPRPLSDFKSYLPPEMQAAANAPQQQGPAVPSTTPPSTFASEVPIVPPDQECK